MRQHKHTDTEGTKATPLYVATIFILIIQLQHHKHTNTEGTRTTPLHVHIKQLKHLFTVGKTFALAISFVSKLSL
jgi:hypothetical protein